MLIEFFNRGSADSKLSSLKILFDFIVFYDGKSSSRSPEIKNTEDSLIFTHDCLSAVTSALYNPVTDIQAAAVEGFSKLFLMKIIDDEQVPNTIQRCIILRYLLLDIGSFAILILSSFYKRK